MRKNIFGIFSFLYTWLTKIISISYSILVGFKIKKHISTFYSNENKRIDYDKKIAIYIADGKIGQGGLADRLRGIVSVYKLCKELDIDFRIYFVHPFCLNEYLVPASYNWIIAANEISYNKKIANAFYKVNIHKIISNFPARAFLKKNYLQYHFYSALKTADDVYGALFKELFKPSDELQKTINYHLEKINGDYISVSLRFMGLLDQGFEARNLSNKKRQSYIDRCLEHLKEIHLDNNYKKIFVTTDSQVFLNEISELDYVYIIAGEIVHIDDKKTHNNGAYMKVFLDFFILANSKKIYLVVDGKMYNSTFPYYASLSNNVPFSVKFY
jgi:hypothetical protein